VIDSKLKISKDVVKSVTSSDDFCALQYSGPGVGIKPGLMAKITERLDNSGINIKLIFNSHTRINLFLSHADVEKAYKVLKDLTLNGVNKINITNEMATIAVVGCGMTEKPGIAARLFKSVADAGINVRTISSGASDYCTYFIVNKSSRDKAVKVIHKEFFN
jgi:aspartate kinase/aspartokinase/homoserine dehydrogenase 1